MEPEEREPAVMKGWHVVEAGLRQAWPFLGLACPVSGREVRFYIDSSFSVLPGWPVLRQHDDAVLPVLGALVGLTIDDARSGPTNEIRLELEGLVLEVQGIPNEWTSHSPWSIYGQ